MMLATYQINNENSIDSPALLVYKNRIEENIAKALALTSVDQLRPHVKTHKLAEITKMMIGQGIKKFKCSTIAEAEMLAMAGAADVLLAYQPTRVKANRLLLLKQKFPNVNFSCLIDNLTTAKMLSTVFTDQPLAVWIDVNIGMDRTGIMANQVSLLYEHAIKLSQIQVLGLHAYDGHIYDQDLAIRKSRVQEVYQIMKQLQLSLQDQFNSKLKMVLGGTPTFHLYAKLDTTVEVGPGTFVFWDEDYNYKLAELNFSYAAILLTRVISIIDHEQICIDLGHKSVASENPFPRVRFLNDISVSQVRHSEEHMVLKVNDASQFEIGMTLYAVPLHICPTVALYNQVQVVEEQSVLTTWDVIARDRNISI